MKALVLTLVLIGVVEAQAVEGKEKREIAGQMMMTKKKKKESMWARDLRGKLSSQSAFIRTM